MVVCETKQIISHKIINKSGPDSEKIILNVEVDLIDGRAPNETELEELSKYLLRNEEKQDNISIHYYLPGTKPGSDAYALADYDHDTKVKIIKYILLQQLLSK